MRKPAMTFRHKKPHKYHAKPTVIDGFHFDSLAEAARYRRNKILVTAGELSYFLMQVPFHLPGNIIYRVDFLEVYKNDFAYYVDVKGMLTQLARTKIALVEAHYPVKIKLVKYNSKRDVFNDW